MDSNNKLNKKLIIEKPLLEKKKSSGVLPIVLIIFLVCAAVAYLILEKLNYIDYLDFI